MSPCRLSRSRYLSPIHRSMVTRRKFAQWPAAALAGAPPAPRGWAIPGKAARPFKLSVMLWTLRPKYTAEQAIDLVAGAGYEGFELVDEDKKWTAEDVQRIRGRMAQLGVVCDAIAGIKTGFAETGAAQKLADELTARMAQAQQLGCRRIILLSCKRDSSIPRDKQHAVCIENLQRAADVAAKHNFVLLLEPIDTLENPSIYLTKVEEAFAIARSLNSPAVQVLYDVYHQARGLNDTGNVSSLLLPVKGNVDLLGLVHIANVPGRRAPDNGKINYPQLYSGLQAYGYHGWMAMEFLPLGDPKMELQRAIAGQ
jgi:hydroxypyruvate isomerase